MSSSDKNLPVDKEQVSYADQETREENGTDPNDNKAASTTTGVTETNAGGPKAVGQSVASGSNSVSGSSLGGNIMNTSKSGSSANAKSGSATAGTSVATSNTGSSQKSAGKANTATGDKSRKSDQKSKSKSSKKSTAKKNVISVKSTAKGSVSSNSSSGSASQSNKSTSVKSKPPQVSSKSQPATVPPVSNAKAAPTPKKAAAAPKNRESFVNPIASTIGSRIFTKPDLGGLEVDSSLHFDPPMVTANEIANMKAQPGTTPTTTVIASQPATGPLPVKTSTAPSASSETPTSSNPPISMPPPIEQCNGGPNLSGNNATGSNVGVTSPNNSGTSTQFSPGLITKGAAIADASGPVGNGSSIGASKSEPFNEEGTNVNNAPSSTTVTPITSIVHLDSGAGTFSATRLPSEYPVPASASNCGNTASTTALPQVDSLSQYKVESASNVNNNASNQSLDTGNSLAGGSSSTNTSSDINFNQFK